MKLSTLIARAIKIGWNPTEAEPHILELEKDFSRENLAFALHYWNLITTDRQADLITAHGIIKEVAK